MARFLIAMLRTTDPVQEFMYQAFKVPDNLSAYEVQIPSNTLFFIFATANIDTVEELLSSFMTVQISAKITSEYSLSTDAELQYEDPKKRYWIGKVIEYEGCNYFVSTRANVLVPLQWLNENDVIINM